MKIGIVVPMYNEESRMIPFINALINFCKKDMSKKDYEIIFVNDGSKDKTLQILKEYKNKLKNKIKIISYTPNHGKGYAVKKGILSSNSDIIIFIDGDGSISPDQIPKMLEKLKDYDLVIGDRYSKESNIKQPSYRVLTGTVFSKIANLIFPIKTVDTVCGFKGFNKNVAHDLFWDLKSTGWVFDIEVIYKAQKKNYSIYKLPFTWVYKEGTQMKFYTPILMIWELIKLKLKLLC